MSMFGSMPEVQGMVSKLSVPELVKIAQAPPSGDPTAQYAAVAELSNRQRMQTPPQQPQSTVIEEMAAQAMPQPQTSAAPGDPIGQGIASLMQQQQAPQGMADGGSVSSSSSSRRVSRGTADILENLPGIMEMLGPSYRSEALDADGARSLVDQFRGEDHLSPMLERIDQRDEEARLRRRQGLWMALARGGFAAAGTPGGWGRALGAGGIAGLDAANTALGDYNEDMSRSDDRRSAIATATQSREDRYGAAGLDAMLDSQRTAREGERALASDATGIARVGEELEESRLDRQQRENQVRVLADQLFEANQGTMVEDGTSARTVNGRPAPDVPFSRPYSREDALNDAIALSTEGRRQRRAAPDDLPERVRAATAVVDQFSGATPEQREIASRFLAQVMSGEIGNRGTSTERGSGGVATGARAPSEARVQPSQADIDAYANSRRGNVVGGRDGERVITPYTR